MEFEIQINEKPDKKPIGPSKLECMKAYMVVKVGANFREADYGDILVRFPSGSGGVFVLNCTRQRMFFDKSSTNRDWDSNFQCERAFKVKSIVLTFDSDDKPT